MNRNTQIIDIYNTSLSAKVEYAKIAKLLCERFNISRNRLSQILSLVDAPRWVRCICCGELFLIERGSKAKYCQVCNTVENRILIRRLQHRIIYRKERYKKLISDKYFNYFKEAYVR